ncbi:MAG: GDSL-type esterase/lipase family protein [Fimbriimonas sp.]
MLAFLPWVLLASHLTPSTGQNQAVNSAIVPVTHNRDFPLYDWMPRHETILAHHLKFKPDVVFIGDSITHRFGGEPIGTTTDHTPLTGKPVWDKQFAHWKPSNLGFGYDRTENVLWRIQHGEIDGIRPRAFVFLIGTNNLGLNTPEQIRDGMVAILDAVHAKHPRAQLLVLGLLPRNQSPNAPERATVKAINALYAGIKKPKVEFLDIGDRFLEPDGSISTNVMFDFLHPMELGYAKFAEGIVPTLAKWLDHK